MSKSKIDLFAPMIVKHYDEREAKLSVLHGFSDDYNTRSLKFTTEFSSPANLLAAVKEAIPDRYNGFSVENLAALLEQLYTPRGLEFKLPEGQFNDDFSFSFGREGSPVLYIRSTRGFWLEHIERIHQASRADEVSIEPNGEIRLWWD